MVWLENGATSQRAPGRPRPRRHSGAGGRAGGRAAGAHPAGAAAWRRAVQRGAGRAFAAAAAARPPSARGLALLPASGSGRVPCGRAPTRSARCGGAPTPRPPKAAPLWRARVEGPRALPLRRPGARAAAASPSRRRRPRPPARPPACPDCAACAARPAAGPALRAPRRCRRHRAQLRLERPHTTVAGPCRRGGGRPMGDGVQRSVVATPNPGPHAFVARALTFILVIQARA
jgi:hypothetical protein